MKQLNSCALTTHQRIYDEEEGSSWYNRRIKKSVVVTFVWRTMNEREQCAFHQGVKILGNHPFYIIHPQSFSVDYLKRQYAGIQSLPLPDENFRSVDTYNQMLLSPWFYALFSDYEYMLIYQIDAYVFSDQLDYWTTMGYDYIGAPWMLNDKLYERSIGQWVTRLLQRRPIYNHHIHSAHLFHRVGNGGFSLRRIPKMQEIMEKNQQLLHSLEGKHERQEDVAISIILKEKEQLNIPSWKLALYFSFEKAPAKCFELTHGVLPFGCHDTNQRNWNSFWKYYIPQEKEIINIEE